MKKKLLTFVTSYLLLAAFIGSAETKMLHPPGYAGAGAFQFSGSSSGGPAGSGWTSGEPNEGMEWLLAYYYGTETDSAYVQLEQPTEPSDETLATNEESEEKLPLAEGMWLNYNIISLAYGDGLYAAATDQSAVSGFMSEDNPQVDFVTFPREFYDPPSVIIYQSNKEEFIPLASPVIHPKPSPAINNPKKTIPVTHPNTNPVTANIPPVGVHLPPPTLPIGEPLVPVLPNGPGKPGYFPPPKPGWESPNNGQGASPAPVPEPATMLLLSTSLVGLAFTRRKK